MDQPDLPEYLRRLATQCRRTETYYLLIGQETTEWQPTGNSASRFAPADLERVAAKIENEIVKQTVQSLSE